MITKVLEGGLASATVLVSFGVLIGKINPLQLLVLGLIETVLFVINCHIGYTILGAVDIGGSIFIHAFGAYFGVTIGIVTRWRNYAPTEDKQETSTTSDMFSLLGSILLWLYWPSFNALLATADARHRAYINTYISLLASTVCTFIASAIFGEGRKFQAVDVQNATLAGGVMVGATADLMLQPYGAFLAGSLAGLVSTFGYQVIQPALQDSINFHDSCGVNNLHGIPGILGGLLSALLCSMANEDIYGPALYIVMGNMAPLEGTEELALLQSRLSQIEGGLGWTANYQALMQLTALGITLAIAVVAGIFTGLLINIEFLCSSLKDHELFEDFEFFDGAGEEPDKPEMPEPLGTGFEFSSSHEAAQALAGLPGQEDISRDSSSHQSVALDEVKQDPGVALVNGELANYYRRKSSVSYHPSMAIRRASTLSTGSGHPHVPDVNELMASQGGHYNYGYEEMAQPQEYGPVHQHPYYPEYGQ